jgi:hypothetical protein
VLHVRRFAEDLPVEMNHGVGGEGGARRARDLLLGEALGVDLGNLTRERRLVDVRRANVEGVAQRLQHHPAAR